MKKSKIQNILYSKGYVSIEALIVAGLIIATGAFLISKLVWNGKDIATTNNNNMTVASKTMDDNSFVVDSDNSHNQTISSNSQLPNKDDFTCDLENPSDLTDYEYAVIDDNYINSELKKIDEMVSKISDSPTPPPEFLNNMKANILKLKEFKGGIIIIDCHGNKTNIEIPSCIDGKEVVAIAPMAFALKPPKPSNDIMPKSPGGKIKSVKLPNTLKYIGNTSFMFNKLTDITIPDSVVEIGNSAFGYNKLTSIKLGSNLRKIGRNAFCSNDLISVTIPNNVIEVGNSAFLNNKITSIKFGNNLKIIENRAFARNQLESVVVPDNVTSLGFDAFEDNPLKSKIIPKTCEEAKQEHS